MAQEVLLLTEEGEGGAHELHEQGPLAQASPDRQPHAQLWGLGPEVFLLPFLFYFTCPTQAESPKPIPAGATHSETEANFCNKHFWFKTKKKTIFF